MFHKVNSYELNKLQTQLESLLFTLENADFFFLGAFDNFADYEKTDRQASDPDIIDLSEQALVLPLRGRSTKKIDSSHLYSHKVWPVKILSPLDSEVVSSNHVNSSFGSMFSDLTTGWLYEVVTTNQNGASIAFSVPIAGKAKDEIEVLVNRLSFIPHSVSPQTLIPRVSTDDVNYATLLGFEEGILIADQKKTYSIEFETNKVQFLAIELSKTTPDEEIEANGSKRYKYLFGLKNISAYTSGRIQRARYQSKPFDFNKEEEKISAVSIRSHMIIPAGTTIDFSVALADTEGVPVTGFLPIKPITKGAGSLGASEIIRFGTAEEHQTRFAVTSAAPQWGTIFKGITFYQLGQLGQTIPEEHPPIFGMARLYRGFKVWTRDTSLAITTKQVADNYVSFAASDTEQVYDVVTETPSFLDSSSANVNKITLICSKPVYYLAGKGHQLIPGDDIKNVHANLTPNYAIYNVQKISQNPSGQISFTADSVVMDLSTQGVSNFILTGANAPVLSETGQQRRFVEGRDYQFETTTLRGIPRPTGKIIFISGGAIVVGGANKTSLTLSYTLDPDVTHKVSAINGNQVELVGIKATPADTFLIDYRFTPVPPNDILKASIRIKDKASVAGGDVVFFVEGRDFVIDPGTGAIQRQPNGKIPSKGAIYADFSYKEADKGIETYTTWCRIDDPQGIQIKLELDPLTKQNLLVSDDAAGEKFLVNSTQGLVDLTKGTSTPSLGPGWVQFIVRSKNPDANKTWQTNLVDQVIQLRDINKKRVFVENNSYFKEILAIRTPMSQKTLNHLKVNTLVSDHSVFALDTARSQTGNDLYGIVVNYNPNATSDLYLYVPQPDNSSTLLPQLLYEIYRLEWSSKQASVVAANKLIVRCDLERSTEVDGGLTPKVFDYMLRAGF